ncbi:unnamed protein product [Polarella glacialis]|uniref:Uncharacterized protein n=1 Tax=Polarella glacialis TaxID=89957 RepID=A0A813EFI5_POLGL|nr:unnamed protein product [Polarella glacialis]
MYKLQRWLETSNGNMPFHGSADLAEVQLQRWISYVKHRYRYGNLPEECIAQLRQMPHMASVVDGWRRDRSSYWADEWREIQLRILSWMKLNEGRLPSRMTKDRAERNLGKDLKGMVSRYIRGLLAPEQSDMLMSLMPECVRLSDKDKAHSAFDCQLAYLRQFVSRMGRLPKQSSRPDENKSQPEENKLARWLSKVVLACRKGSLPAASVYELRLVEGMPERIAQWDSSARLVPETGKAISAFDRHLIDLRGFVLRMGRLPKQSWRPDENKSESEENKLAIWLAREVLACRKGSLPAASVHELRLVEGMPERLDQWDTLVHPLPETVRATDKDKLYSAFDRHLATLRQYVSHMERLPKQQTSDSKENKLAIWLAQSVASAYRKGSLPAASVHELSLIEGMPERIAGWDASVQKTAASRALQAT